MKLDRHHDPIDDLERDLLHEIELCAKDLGGKMEKYTISNSSGEIYNQIKITYNAPKTPETYKPVSYTHLTLPTICSV